MPSPSSAFSAGSAPRPRPGPRRPRSSWWIDSIPGLGARLALVAHVDVATPGRRRPGSSRGPGPLPAASSARPRADPLAHPCGDGLAVDDPSRSAPSSAARSRPSACAREPSPAKRTTTTPPGSTPMTTPSPKRACTTSSPTRTWRPAAGSAVGPGAAAPPPRWLRGRPASALLLRSVSSAGISSRKRLRHVPLAPAVQRARARVGEVEVALRPRDPDVTEPPLLLDVARLDRAHVREDAVLACRS